MTDRTNLQSASHAISKMQHRLLSLSPHSVDKAAESLLRLHNKVDDAWGGPG